jgi:molybdopterin converting factor small subunit
MSGSAPTTRPLDVRLFGRLRDLAGNGTIVVAIEETDTARSSIDRLLLERPELGEAISSADAGRTYAVALDRSYIDPDDLVASGRELALIPPVSGG